MTGFNLNINKGRIKMGLKEQLVEDMKVAMKAKETGRPDAIRLLRPWLPVAPDAPFARFADRRRLYYRAR